MIKVSVILPVYNEEKYLKQCLESLCHQTLSDIEIICVDDGSTDESMTILQNYEKLDDRIKVISQKNQYAGVARNNGMKYATGKYLIFLDSDDFFELDMLEKLYLRAEEDSLDVVLCHYAHLDDRSGKKIEINFSGKDSFFPKEMKCFSGADIEYAGIFQSMVGWAWDKLFRADFVREMGYQFQDLKSSNDGFFVYMLVARAKRIGVMKERLVWHRMYNEKSLSNTREQNWESGFRMMEMIHRELIKQDIYNTYEQSFISWVIEFQVCYVMTLYQREAFFKTYRYIQEHAEPEYKALQYQGELICDPKHIQYYNWIMELEPEQFLLRRLQEQDVTINDAASVAADAAKKNQKKGWVFPYGKIPKNSRLIIYGAGNVGRSYFEQLMFTGYCKDVHIVDQNHTKYYTKEYPVESIEMIKNLDFDCVLVAISDDQTKTLVQKTLNDEYGISLSKIV